MGVMLIHLCNSLLCHGRVRSGHHCLARSKHGFRLAGLRLGQPLAVYLDRYPVQTRSHPGLCATGMAYYARLARTTMLEVLRQDYVRTARAKGMRERVVIYRHALRNAMIPLVTVIGLSFGFMVTGAFFIENIFNIPGIAEITHLVYQLPGLSRHSGDDGLVGGGGRAGQPVIGHPLYCG